MSLRLEGFFFDHVTDEAKWTAIKDRLAVVYDSQVDSNSSADIGENGGEESYDNGNGDVGLNAALHANLIREKTKDARQEGKDTKPPVGTSTASSVASFRLTTANRPHLTSLTYSQLEELTRHFMPIIARYLTRAESSRVQQSRASAKKDIKPTTTPSATTPLAATTPSPATTSATTTTTTTTTTVSATTTTLTTTLSSETKLSSATKTPSTTTLQPSSPVVVLVFSESFPVVVPLLLSILRLNAAFHFVHPDDVANPSSTADLLANLDVRLFIVANGAASTFRRSIADLDYTPRRRNFAMTKRVVEIKENAGVDAPKTITQAWNDLRWFLVKNRQDMACDNACSFNDTSLTPFLMDALRETSSLLVSTAPTTASAPTSTLSIAYVMRTSGSTGWPKTVRVTHDSIVPNIVDIVDIVKSEKEIATRSENRDSKLSQKDGDVVFLASPLTFDPCIVEIFVSLATGSVLVTTSSRVRRSTILLEKLLKEWKVTFLQGTPSLLRSPNHHLLRTLLRSSSSLRFLFFGGESPPSAAMLRSLKEEANRTNVLNIYGITEVSCWASIAPISLGNSGDDATTIGQPLSNTDITLENVAIDNDGRRVGEIVIGTASRVCYLDGERENEDEDVSSFGTRPSYVQRPTGDLGELTSEGRIKVIGRLDDRVKIWGKMVDLSQLKWSLLRRLPASLTDSGRWWFEIIDVAGSLQPELIVVTNLNHLRTDDWRRFNEALANETSLSKVGGTKCATLPLLSSPPLSRHGKVDRKELRRLAMESLKSSNSDTIRKRKRCDDPESDRMEEVFVRQLSASLSIDERQLVREIALGSTFQSVGGDSFSGVSFINAIEEWLSHAKDIDVDAARENTSYSMTYLYESLMSDRSIKDILSFWTCKKELPLPTSPHKSSRVDHSFIDRVDVHPRKSPFSSRDSDGVFVPVRCYARQNLERTLIMSQTNHDKWADVVEKFEESRGVTEQRFEFQETRQRPSLVERWRFRLGKCVDASPVVMTLGPFDFSSADSPPTHGVAFVGSHSHAFSAILFPLTGETRHDVNESATPKPHPSTHFSLWTTILGDRVDAAATLTRSGSLVAVGCYDGRVYFLDSLTGRVVNAFQTGDQVKSSPVVHDPTGNVFAGSRDGFLYCFRDAVTTDGYEVKLVARKNVNAGAIVATPFIDGDRLIIATLKGEVLCLDVREKEKNIDRFLDIIWRYSLAAPIFSSPYVHRGTLFVGCVDGTMNVFGTEKGASGFQWITSKKCPQPLFSSPLVIETPYSENKEENENNPLSGSDLVTGRSFAVFGCHDGVLYAIDADGVVSWSHSFVEKDVSPKLYSSPAVFNPSLAPLSSNNRPIIVACSSDGRLRLIDSNSGVKLAEMNSGAEIFSSPVVVKGTSKVLVGSRNDFLLCYDVVFE